IGMLRPHGDLAATGNQMPIANGAPWPYLFADKPIPLVETSAWTDNAAPGAVGQNVRSSASARSAPTTDDYLIGLVELGTTNQDGPITLRIDNDASLDANLAEPPTMLLENPPIEDAPHGAVALAAFLATGLWQKRRQQKRGHRTLCPFVVAIHIDPGVE